MAWTLYKEVEYATGAIPAGDLTGFPVPVWITTDADIAAEIGGGGGIKFTSADGLTDLPFGLYPSANLAAGTVHARVKIDPDTDATVGTTAMRLYYSSTESTTQNKAGTTNNGYAIFMPLEEDPSGSAPQIRDWVSDALVGTSEGTMLSGALVAATVGNGLDFDGSDDRINIPNTALPSITGDLTYECWLKFTEGGVKIPFGAYDGSNVGWGIGMAINAAGKIDFYSSGSGSWVGASTASNDGAWHLIGVTLSGTTLTHYRDGATDGTGTSAAPGANTGTKSLMATAGGGSFLAGQADELRISTVARSANWMGYSHATDLNKTTIWTLSAEQGGGGGVDPEAGLIGGKLIRGGLLLGGALVR